MEATVGRDDAVRFIMNIMAVDRRQALAALIIIINRHHFTTKLATTLTLRSSKSGPGCYRCHPFRV